MVKAMMRFTGSIKITESMIYHRLQKLVDQGILTKVSVDGSKEVLYAKANIPLNNK
jgi:DNA-binding HxlR family transcriptional regulator